MHYSCAFLPVQQEIRARNAARQRHDGNKHISARLDASTQRARNNSGSANLIDEVRVTEPPGED